MIRLLLLSPIFIGFVFASEKNETECLNGSFKYPANCPNVECTYVATWRVHNSTHACFTVKAKMENGRWMALGFSKEKKMVEKKL